MLEGAVGRTWHAPGQLTLIGEHAGFNEGFSLSLALPLGCATTVSMLLDDVVEVSSGPDHEPVEIPFELLRPGSVPADNPSAAIAAGVVWSLCAAGHRVPGVAIDLYSDLPPGLGFAATTAVGCSVAAAVSDLCGLGLGPAQLAAVARDAAERFIQRPAGAARDLVNQVAALHGTSGQSLLHDSRSQLTEPIGFDPDALGLRLLVVDLGRSRGLDTDRVTQQLRTECLRAAEILGVRTLRDIGLDDLEQTTAQLDPLLARRVHHVVTENDRTLACAELLRAGHLAEIGPLLTASHDSLRADFGAGYGPDPLVDLAVQIMYAFDALGARVTGGCVVGLLTPRQAPAANVAIRSAFSGRGYPAPVGWIVQASDGLKPLG